MRPGMESRSSGFSHIVLSGWLARRRGQPAAVGMLHIARSFAFVRVVRLASGGDDVTGLKCPRQIDLHDVQACEVTCKYAPGRPVFVRFHHTPSGSLTRTFPVGETIRLWAGSCSRS